MEYDLKTAVATLKALKPLSNDAVGKILESLGICSRSHVHNIVRSPEVEDELKDIERQHAQESAETGLICTKLLRKKVEPIEIPKDKDFPWIKQGQDHARKVARDAKEQPKPTEPTPRLLQAFQVYINANLAPEPKSGKKGAK